MKNSEQYKALPAKVSSTVLLMVQKNFKSFFKSLAEFNKNPEKYKARPNLPRYLDTEKGRFVTAYTNQAISKKVFNKFGKILLSKTNIEFNTRVENFQQINCIRVVPKIGYYVIEVVYTILDVAQLKDNGLYLGIDLGLNNLATITSNKIGFEPIIHSGNPLKSINQFYNKKMAEAKNILETRNKKRSSKRINKLSLNRKNKIDNYMHRSSKQIVETAKKNNINTIVIGKNDGWKQEINIGTKNNQSFVNIPHSRLVEMIQYKCEREGISVIMQEESYTSKASFLSLDRIPVYKKKSNETIEFSGYRQNRGLYKIKGENKVINADVNGSLNIIRKAFPKTFADGIEGVGVHPVVVKI